MTKTPTPRTAILDRITEDDVCEWMQARLAADNEFCVHDIACIEICAWDDGRNEFTAHGRVSGDIHGIGWRKSSLDAALTDLADDIDSKLIAPKELRQKAAALLAEAEKLEAASEAQGEGRLDLHE